MIPINRLFVFKQLGLMAKHLYTVFACMLVLSAPFFAEWELFVLLNKILIINIFLYILLHSKPDSLIVSRYNYHFFLTVITNKILAVSIVPGLEEAVFRVGLPLILRRDLCCVLFALIHIDNKRTSPTSTWRGIALTVFFAYILGNLFSNVYSRSTGSFMQIWYYHVYYNAMSFALFENLVPLQIV